MDQTANLSRQVRKSRPARPEYKLVEQPAPPAPGSRQWQASDTRRAARKQTTSCGPHRNFQRVIRAGLPLRSTISHSPGAMIINIENRGRRATKAADRS